MYFVLTKKADSARLVYRSRTGEMTSRLQEAQLFRITVLNGRASVHPFLPEGDWDLREVTYLLAERPLVVEALPSDLPTQPSRPDEGQAVS